MVMDMIRGLPVDAALDALRTTHRRAAPMIVKVIRSAVANAEQIQAVGSEQLFLEHAVVNEGPLKQGRIRWRPGAQGRAKPYRKRTSHIEVKLGILEEAAAAPRRAAPKKTSAETVDALEEVVETAAAETVEPTESEAVVETAEVEAEDTDVKADAETEEQDETKGESSEDETPESKD